MVEDYIQIQWTCGSIDEARMVSHHLVQKRLVACANIIPWVESIYLWDGQIETNQESKVIFKTRAELFAVVKEEILAKSKYEVPEILKIPIVDGNPDYLAWITESTSL